MKGKRSQRLLWQLAVLMIAASALGVGGCAQDVGDINRVQPFALKKAHFVGEKLTDTSDDPEFWSQATLIDVGYGAAQDGLFTSTYAQPLTRIKWQITEDLLIARLAYERIDSTDGKGLAAPTQEGIVVAAFRIRSHFDVQRDFNPTTGEQSNVLNENTTDRPWYEREYFRVDWSENLNTDSYDFDTLSQVGLYGGVKYESLRYDITDPNDQQAPVFELEKGYFDITGKVFAKPQMIDLSHLGWGIDAFPACFLDPDFMGGSGPDGNCNPVELTLRHSFRKVEDTDYEPLDWDGFRFSAFGAFTEDRLGYSRNYGLTDDRWVRMVARYNLWQRSHYYADAEKMTGAVACMTEETTPYGEDPNRDLDGNGTADECESVTSLVGGESGSRCDVYNQKCTLPFQARKVRPVVWYFAAGSAQEYFDATREAAHEWDVAMRTAVQTSKYAECMRTKSAGCAVRFPMYSGQQDENQDAILLTTEVDNCRDGLSYPERGKDEAQCVALADELGAARGYSEGVIAIAKMEQVLVLCHSPVQANDAALCAGERLPEGVTALMCQSAWKEPESELFQQCKNALNVRPGDIRYHAVNVISIPQTPSPWGIMVDANDPLTGEVISASINVWSHVNDLFSQKVVDTMRYIDGELTDDQVTEGDYVYNWSQAAKAAAGGGGAGMPMDTQGINSRIADFVGVAPEALSQYKYDLLPDSVSKQLRSVRREAQEIRASFEAPSAMRPIYNARAQAAKGSSVEAQLMTPMLQEMMGINGMPMNEAVLDRASLMRGGNPGFQRDMRHWKESALAERGACILQEAPSPFSISALSDVMQAKFGAFNRNDPTSVQVARAEKMRNYLAQRAQYAVIIHEMGHSVGLRHNFVSSADAWGFRPQYWQLRTRNGQVSQPCANVGDGRDCVGPRYLDPVTQEERDGLLWMFMHSSVMDYAGEVTQDTLGLGAYDFAATRMFYGDVVSVFSDPSYTMGDSAGRSAGMLAKTDNFGGIVGMTWEIGGNDIHYSQLNNAYSLIQDCAAVDPANFKPSNWNEDVFGAWHPVLDGHIVAVDGQYTRCKQQKVDYVNWTTLRKPTTTESPNYRGGGSITADGRVRVPYGFASDGWADLGNLSVYRHDNGADAYELFDFLISQQEVNHIFDNYRRNRTTFSIRGAANRALSRYNEKMRDAAKGLGLLRNIYVNFSLEIGYDFESLWPIIANEQFRENILASGLAFDHFTRQLARPEHGPHYLPEGDTVLRSTRDATANIDASQTVVTIPNGSSGYFEYVTFGGRPIENQLADDKGDYSNRYTINAGSYYEKLYTAMLLTESVDNFISSSRTDFLDPRYRAVSMADLFPEGYRRWLSNFLTNDDTIRGPRLMANATGRPLVDSAGYPSQPIGWTTWWGNTPRICFPNPNTTLCTTFTNQNGVGLDPITAGQTAIVDPQVSWEQQKFLIAWTLMYLPENQQQRWLNSLRLWEKGVDADPEIQNRIEFHHPTGKIYVARTEGTEVIFGKKVQMGIAARVLEYANELLLSAYEVTDGPDLNADGTPDWYMPVYSADGAPIIKWDPSIQAINALGIPSRGAPGCNSTENFACTCADNRACIALESYAQIPFFLREAIDAYGLGRPSMRGIY
jgi:hypothetical protein